MGGKHSRQQREQKQQTRKQRKEKKASKRSAAEEAAGSGGSGGIGGDWQCAKRDLSVIVVTPVQAHQQQTGWTEVVTVGRQTNGSSSSSSGRAPCTVADVVTIESPANVSERDGRVGVVAYADHNEPDPVATTASDEGDDTAKGSVTITICMLKMESNAANETSLESCSSTSDCANNGEPTEDVPVTAISTPLSPPIGGELLTMAAPRCGCFENGNCSTVGLTSSALGPAVTINSATSATHPTVTSGPIPTIRSGCNCNAAPMIGANAGSGATIDNRLNNNNEHQQQHLLSGGGGGGGTLVLTRPGGPTPTTTASFAAASSASMATAATAAAASLAMWSSNLPTVNSAGTPARSSQPFGNFLLGGGGDSASIAQQLLHRLRHHQHHHHHHHHHHLMHLHHLLHHHHHHHPADPAAAPQDTASSGGIPDWRHQVLRQWHPTPPVSNNESVYGTLPAPAANPGSSGATAPPLFPTAFIDVDLKDKLEGLELGSVGQQRTSTSNNNNSSAPLPGVDTTGEHPRSVGECPTCCAMAMAANGSGSLGGGVIAGAGVGHGGPNAVFNGNAGEVEEKILNTVNQQLPSPAAGGERVSAGATPTLPIDPITTEPDGGVKAVPRSVASSATESQHQQAATGGSTAADAGKDAAGGCDRIVVDGNSSKLTTTATPSAVSSSLANPTSDSTNTTATDAGGASPSSPSSSSPGTPVKATPTTSSTTSSGSCCCKPPTAPSASAAATLLHSLSLSGRRSRSNASTTASCNGSCCGVADGAALPPTEPQSSQPQRTLTNWISGGQRAERGGANSSTPAASGSAKTKKAKWRVSLNCTIRRAAGGSGSSSSGAAGHTKASQSRSAGAVASEQLADKSPACSSGTTLPSAAPTDVAPSSIVSAGPSSHRGSLLISSSVSAKLLKGESDKDDTCVCTAYRKMSESPPPPQLSTTGGATSPSRPLSPALPTVASASAVPEEGPNATTFMPIPLNMLSLVGSSGATSPPPATGGAPSLQVAAEPFSGLLHNHHHHHHHHAMAAALAADHHPSFFFPAATAGPAGAVAAHHHHGPPNGGAVGASPLFGNLSLGPGHSSANGVILLSDPAGVFDLSSDDFSLEDCDERARIQRELEIREGVDAPPNFHPRRLMSGGTITSGPTASLPIAFFYARDLMERRLLMANRFIQPIDAATAAAAAAAGGCAAGAAAMAAAAAAAGRGVGGFGGLRIHSQVDFIHCLVPDLQKITSCSFYWGKMDRYEAERLLEGKPEGTFLLRDSAQEEFLFSVSFRKYNRSLHARIEQFNHKFSFDSRDPGVYTASTVTGLLEHYKDPSCVMFFEPMLTYPLNRNFSFSLQQLCRAAIVSNTTYDGINELALPKSLKAYLKEYHYRQRVRFRPLDEHLYSNA